MHRLPAASETGLLGVMHLKRAWARVGLQKTRSVGYDPIEGHRDRLVFHALGLGLEQALQFLGRTDPTFEDFERWIVDVTGGVSPDQVGRINANVTGVPPPPAIAAWLHEIDAHEPVLSADDLAFCA